MARSFLSYYYMPLALMLLMINFDHVQGKLTTGLFAFGDSFYDTGDSNYLATATMHANIPPYGETFFKKATGRFSDGRLIPDFIAQYADIPSPPPFLQPGLMSYKNGVNFACAGAGALNETFQGRIYSSILTVSQEMIDGRPGTLAIESFLKILSKDIIVPNFLISKFPTHIPD